MHPIEVIHKAHWGRLLAALIGALGDFDVAEEALQDAFAAAVVAWSTGVPENPAGWLYATAKHKGVDRLRQRARHVPEDEAPPRLDEVEPSPNECQRDEEPAVPDERLRLIFTCCHPALAAEAQVALTLRTLCGLSTEAIARAFLVPTTTMAQRLVRAKAKIRAAGIPYRLPAHEDLPARLVEVMSVIYLVFSEGHTAAAGPELVRRDLCSEAIRLARVVRALLERAAPELDALLALMLLTDARREARVSAAGELIRLADQDRTSWDHRQIDEGRQLLSACLTAAPPGPYALEAAIAAVHADARDANDTDWVQIAGLYQRLYEQHPSPAVALNQAVAVCMAEGPAAALARLEPLAEPLGQHHPFHVARGDFLLRLERREEAARAFRHARALAQNETERRFLEGRIAACAAGRH